MRRYAADFAGQTGRTARTVAQLVRRVVVTAAGAVRWTFTSYADESGRGADDDAELFGGVGFASRPPADGMPEAIVVNVAASANHPVIVAVRDRTTEAAVIERAQLGADETLVFNSGRVLKLTAGGDVLIGDPSGSFEPLALASHTHRVPGIVGNASYAPGPPTGPNTTASSANTAHVKAN